MSLPVRQLLHLRLPFLAGRHFFLPANGEQVFFFYPEPRCIFIRPAFSGSAFFLPLSAALFFCSSLSLNQGSVDSFFSFLFFFANFP